MKKNILIKGLFAPLLLMSTLAVADSSYPGADFEPAVLYLDADYLAAHNKPILSSEPAASGQSSAASNQEGGAAAEVRAGKPDELSMESYQAGLILLILLALVFWSIKPQGAAKGGTGVTRYLKKLEQSKK